MKTPSRGFPRLGVLAGGNPQIAKADGDAPVRAYIAAMPGWKRELGRPRRAPPGGTGEDARWIDVHEGELDEAQMAAWVKQAAALPGWVT